MFAASSSRSARVAANLPSIWSDAPPRSKGVPMFGKSWTILRVRGIPIRVHITLLLFLPYVAFVAGMQYKALARSMGVDPSATSLSPFWWGILLAIGLFVAITLHELAHSLVAVQ